MRLFCLFLLFLCSAAPVYAQYVYKGAVDKYPVEFVIDDFSNGDISAVYAYDRFDKPIRISGRQSGEGILLVERNFEAADTTTMRFEGGAIGADSLTGVWFNVRTGRRFDIRLAKVFDLQDCAAGYTDRAILQDAELDSAYFRLLVSCQAGQGPVVSGVRIYQKGDDRLIQELRFEVAFIGFSGLRTDDFNFDGIPDFSVFEGFYAGPNTTSLYFLYDKKTRRYFESEISGVSLEFDHARKRITEVNQCCAGSQVTHTEYKLVNNKMVKTGSKCFKWNHKTNQLELSPARECE